MADYDASTLYTLIQIGVSLNLTVGIDKQLKRFGIAQSHSDANLNAELSAAPPALVNFLGAQLAQAIYSAP